MGRQVAGISVKGRLRRPGRMLHKVTVPSIMRVEPRGAMAAGTSREDADTGFAGTVIQPADRDCAARAIRYRCPARRPVRARNLREVQSVPIRPFAPSEIDCGHMPPLVFGGSFPACSRWSSCGFASRRPLTRRLSHGLGSRGAVAAGRTTRACMSPRPWGRA